MPGATRPRHVVLYTDGAGRQPFSDWLDALDAVSARRISNRVDRLTLGNFGDHKGVGGGVQELRIAVGPGFRVYFAEDGDTVVLLPCGGDKSSQRADIRRAQAARPPAPQGAQPMTPRKPYRDLADYLTQKLQDPDEASAYLALAFEEYEQDSDTGAFLLSVRRVADAQGGIGHLAEETGLNRQTLYRTLSQKGNPRLDTLARILKGLGFRLRVEVASPHREAA